MNGFVILFTLLLTLSATAYRLPWSRTTQVRRYVAVTNSIGYRLQRAQSDQSGNQLVSPYGLSTILSLLYQGTSGQTQQQIGQLGYYDLEQQGVSVSQSYQQLRQYLQRDSGGELQEATAVLYPPEYSVSPQYQEVLQSSYRCLVQQFDYNQGSQSVQEKLDNWVQEQTGGRLSQIYDGIYLSSGLAVLNGIYYRGLFQGHQYQQQVQQLPFYGEGETQSQQSYYETQGTYPYYQDEQFQAVQLPYQDGAFNLLVVLPNQQSGITQLQQQVSSGTVRRILRGSLATQLRVSIPQFRLDYSQTLQQDIQSLGVTIVFGPQAELAGVSSNGDREAYVSQIGQRAVVEIGNYGSGQEGRSDYEQGGYGAGQSTQYVRRYGQQYEYGGRQENQYGGSEGEQYRYGRYGVGEQDQYGGRQQGRYGYGQEGQYQNEGQYEGEQGDEYGQYRAGYRYGSRQQGQYQEEEQYEGQYGYEGERRGQNYGGQQYLQEGQYQPQNGREQQYQTEQGGQYGQYGVGYGTVHQRQYGGEEYGEQYQYGAQQREEGYGRQKYGYSYSQGGVTEFRANRPFLFYVIHKQTGLNVLAGRVSQL